MKKIIILLCLIFVILLAGCSKSKTDNSGKENNKTENHSEVIVDYPATIMVSGTLYYSTNIVADMDENFYQENDAVFNPTSYTDEGIPTKDGETNFDRSLKSKYVVLEDSVAVYIDSDWILFETK